MRFLPHAATTKELWTRLIRAADPWIAWVRAGRGPARSGAKSATARDEGELRALVARLAAAEAATLAKSAFVARVGHELQAPLNGILALTDLALQTDLTPTQHDYLSKIELAAEHLLGVIDEVVDFTQLEAGKVEVERGELDLERIVSHVLHRFGEHESAKGFEPVVDLAPEVPRSLLGDARHLQRVLLELCSQAARLGPPGELVVAAQLLEKSGPEVLVRFAVRHTIVELDAPARERLFREQEQPTSPGLGLLIARRLIALMGGESGVESAPGEGTSLWFTLPLGVLSNGSEARRALLRTDLRNVRALVVDDNEVVRRVVTAMLGRLGFRANAVDSGAAAVDAVRAAAESGEPFALVFLDWQMPGIDGLDTARRLRALGLASPPRLIMLTAYGREDLAREALDCGIDQVITKPASPTAILESSLLALRKGECLEVGDGPRPRTTSSSRPPPPSYSRPPPPSYSRPPPPGDACYVLEPTRCLQTPPPTRESLGLSCEVGT